MLSINGAWSTLLIAALLHFLPTTAAQDTSAFTKASNDSLLWGPYRPNLYLGVRPRLPKSIMTGLLWARVDDMAGVQNNFRYTCEQHEGMAGYGWDSYDPRLGGVQTIHDAGNGIDLVTEFVKWVDRGDNGGSWAVRIRGTPRPDTPRDVKTAVIFSIGLEGFGTLEVADAADGDNARVGFDEDVHVNGQTPDLGAFAITVSKGKGKHPTHGHASGPDKPLDRTRVHSLQVPEAAIWQAKNVMFSSMKETIENLVKQYGQENMPPSCQAYDITNMPGSGNLHFVQKTFEGAFEFDVLFSPVSSQDPITSKEIAGMVKKIIADTRQRYVQAQKPAAPFAKPNFLKFSMSLFSNLIGGIGYFNGDQMIDRSYATEYEEDIEGFWTGTAEARAREAQQLEGPYELFTSIPSRPFFPRGFLWDEGFHLLPILDFDTELALQIIKSWFNTMDENGWIPREQILGPEARSKVPAKFQVQYPHYANPPTLFFVLTDLVDKIRSAASDTDGHASSKLRSFESPEKIKSYLRDLYPLLKRHFEWFRKTQRGEIRAYDRTASNSKEAYRWRGSTQTHLLTSGMDDYPRAAIPHPGELHVDLISWIGMMAQSMAQIASAIDLVDEADEYKTTAAAIIRNIDDLHWSETAQTYCDATVDEYEESIHVCHKGYLSIFPFMLGLLDPSDASKTRQIDAILDLVSDPAELWSEHGIRSLSQKDEFYGKDENYWRSPVWMNMNYLIVKQLLALSGSTANPDLATKSTRIYTSLRKNLVNTVYESWKTTGFAWEQYDPVTGRGQRTQHFTGWTSLVVKIMSMPDLEDGSGSGSGSGSGPEKATKAEMDEWAAFLEGTDGGAAPVAADDGAGGAGGAARQDRSEDKEEL